MYLGNNKLQALFCLSKNIPENFAQAICLSKSYNLLKYKYLQGLYKSVSSFYFA